MRRALFSLCVVLAACRPSSDPTAPPPVLNFTGPSWPDRVNFPGVGQGRLVVTNDYDDTLSFFDATKVGAPQFPELTRVPVGLNPVEIEAPHHAAVSPDGKFLYVGFAQNAPSAGSGPHGSHGSSSVDGRVLMLSTADMKLFAQARVDRSPGDLAMSPNGKFLAVSHYDLLKISENARGEVPTPDARVILLDPRDLSRIEAISTCPAPHGMKFSANSTRLYVACLSDEVAVINLSATPRTVTRVKVAPNAGDALSPLHSPYAIAISPLTGDVFVSCLQSGDVRVLNPTTLTMDATRVTHVGGNPLLSDFSPDGTSLWVPHQGDDRISELDPATGMQRRVFGPGRDACLALHQVIASPDGKSLIGVCEGNHRDPGSLVVFDVASGAVVSSTPVGVFPDFVGWVKGTP